MATIRFINLNTSIISSPIVKTYLKNIMMLSVGIIILIPIFHLTRNIINRTIDKLALANYNKRNPKLNEDVILLYKEELDQLIKFSESNGIHLEFINPIKEGNRIYISSLSVLTAYAKQEVKKSKSHPLRDAEYKDIIFICNSDTKEFPKTIYNPKNKIPGWQSPGIILSREKFISMLKEKESERQGYRNCAISSINADQLIKIILPSNLSSIETPVQEEVSKNFFAVWSIGEEVFISHEEEDREKIFRNI